MVEADALWIGRLFADALPAVEDPYELVDVAMDNSFGIDVEKLYELRVKYELPQAKTGARKKVAPNIPVASRVEGLQSELADQAYADFFKSTDEEHVTAGVQRMIRWLYSDKAATGNSLNATEAAANRATKVRS